MKKILLIITAAMLFSCAPKAGMVKDPASSLIGPLPKDRTNMPIVHLYALDDHVRRLLKAEGKEIPDQSKASLWTVPVGIVEAEPLPKLQSGRHQREIDTSRKLYDEGNYIDAARAVQAALRDEPENVFILECYARALYRTETYRHVSYDFYHRLISLLDRSLRHSNEGEKVIPLDAWFMEAYWKYGTLLMDIGEWEKAAFEISRALAISFNLNDAQPFVLQAYSYLTKAYFHMGRNDVAKYYADAALEISPKNEYVRYYLSRIEEKRP